MSGRALAQHGQGPRFNPQHTHNTHKKISSILVGNKCYGKNKPQKVFKHIEVEVAILNGVVMDVLAKVTFGKKLKVARE